MRRALRVADGVGERLLRDADDLALDARVERRQLVDDEIDRDVVGPTGEIDHALERRGDILAIVRLRTQRRHGSARLDEVRAREVDSGRRG